VGNVSKGEDDLEQDLEEYSEQDKIWKIHDVSAKNFQNKIRFGRRFRTR
jgi:hypothetical protein